MLFVLMFIVVFVVLTVLQFVGLAAYSPFIGGAVAALMAILSSFVLSKRSTMA